MTGQVTSEPSALGCRLHDWTLAAREYTSVRPAFRGVVIDLDDTLYPLEDFVRSGFHAVARFVCGQHGIPALEAFAVLTAARREGPARQEFQTLCARFGLPPSAAGPLLDVFRAHRPVLRLPRESVTVLTHLRATGWRTVVLTNGLPSVQRAKVAALGLGPLVDSVVYANEVTAEGKPDPAVFTAALRRLALPARSCVCVGDDLQRDMAGARAAGLHTVWVSPGWASPGTSAPAAIGADAHIGSLSELPEVLRSMWDMVTSNAA